jgi:hypothetical protein
VSAFAANGPTADFRSLGISTSAYAGSDAMLRGPMKLPFSATAVFSVSR